MDQLPPELLSIIFNELNFNQILICKLVNKKCYSVIKNYYKLRQLSISNYSYFVCKWFYTNENVFNCQCEIKNPNFEFNQFQINQTQFAHLKQLFIIQQKFIETKFLNCLSELENLSIKSSSLKSNEISLKLCNLQTLSIEESEIIDVIILDLPKLIRLKINLFKSYKSKLIFNYCDCIQLLECSRYLKKTKKFFNLKYLYCERLCCSNLDDLFAFNKKIAEVHFNGSADTFSKLKRYRQLYRKDQDLKIYFLGVKLDELPNYELTDYGFHIDERTIQFYVQNYLRLANKLPFVKLINYNCFENHFQVIPANFIRRCVNFLLLEVSSQPKYLDQFKKVLEQCGYANELFINADLSQSFFDNLHKLVPILKCLKINAKNELDFSFLLNFISLEAIKLNQELSLDLIKNLFKQIKKLKYLKFSYQRSLTEISFIDKHNIRLNIDPIRCDFNNLGELLSYLKKETYQKDYSLDMNDEGKLVRSLFFQNKFKF